MKPKTVKSFFKICLDLSYTCIDELKGDKKMTDEEYYKIGSLRAGIQNDLSEMTDLLAKHELKYNPKNY